jgi:hypothetical protein
VAGVGATITRRPLPTDLVRGVGHGAERACRGLRCVESGLRRRLSDAARQAWVTARRGDDVHLREDDRREFVDASLTLDEVGSLRHWVLSFANESAERPTRGLASEASALPFVRRTYGGAIDREASGGARAAP